MGYPFAKSMGRGLFDWMAQHTTSGPYDFRVAAESLQATFEHLDDIEDLLARIDEFISESTGSTWEQRCVASRLLNHDKPALVEAIRGWFDEVRQGPNESYRVFAQHIAQPGDCVVSFNYDVSLDQALRLAGVWNLGDGYGFAIEGFDDHSPVSLLKLHGSINWLASMFGGVSHGPVALGPAGVFGRRPVFADSELMFLGYSNVADSLFPRVGTPALRPLILPTRCKKFYFDTNLGREWEEFWDLLWDNAAQVLGESDRIVICGYSLPLVDERACELLLGAEPYSGQVEVCCGDDTRSIVERLKASGRDAQATDQKYFGEWVKAHIRIGIPEVNTRFSAS
jgi:hypothetical protein